MKVELLKPEKFTSIDIEKVKEEWNKIMDIPNNRWDDLGIPDSLELINNEKLPYTLRTVFLNMLPYLVIQILKVNKS